MAAEDEDDCIFRINLDPSSLAQVKALISLEYLMRAGCRVVKHPDCCILCAMNNDCTRVPLHYNCFPAETLVSACHVKRAYRRQYQGDLVAIVTAGGVELSGTPNHPVLTDRGWVALGALNEGGHIVRSPFDQGVGVLDPDVHNAPTTIGQVFDSLADLGQRIRAVGSDEQFHGDGADGDVDVVTLDGELLPCGHPALVEPVGEPLFTAPDLPGLPGPGGGSPAQRLGRVDLASPRGSGGNAPGGALLDGPVRNHQPVGITEPPVVGEPAKELGECRAATAAALGQSLDGLAGTVALDQVVGIRRLPFMGHVYNLETQAGWYLANNSLVGNCRCKVEGYLELGL